MKYTREFDQKFYNYAVMNYKGIYYSLEVIVKSPTSYKLLHQFLLNMEEEGIKVNFEAIHFNYFWNNIELYTQICEFFIDRGQNLEILKSSDSDIPSTLELSLYPYLYEVSEARILSATERVTQINLKKYDAMFVIDWGLLRLARIHYFHLGALEFFDRDPELVAKLVKETDHLTIDLTEFEEE